MDLDQNYIEFETMPKKRKCHCKSNPPQALPEALANALFPQVNGYANTMNLLGTVVDATESAVFEGIPDVREGLKRDIKANTARTHLSITTQLTDATGKWQYIFI